MTSKKTSYEAPFVCHLFELNLVAEKSEQCLEMRIYYRRSSVELFLPAYFSLHILPPATSPLL